MLPYVINCYSIFIDKSKYSVISRFRDRSLKRDKSASRSSELDSSPNSAGSRSHDGDQDDDDDSLDIKSKK